MAEKIPDQEWESSHPIGCDAMFSNASNLLRHVMASKPLSDLVNDNEPRFTSSYDGQEISRLLINIATYYRVKYDDGSWEHAEWLHEKFDGVGSLVKDTANLGVSCNLQFREACNKIIHAQKLHFDVSTNKSTGVEYLNPKVYLYGTKARKEWKVELDLIESVINFV